MKVLRDNPAEKEARLDWMLEENRDATEASRERAQAARDAARRHAKSAGAYLARAKQQRKAG